MKSVKVVALIGFVILVVTEQSVAAPNAECSKIPERPDESCCKFPKLLNESSWHICHKEAADKIPSASHLNKACYMIECMGKAAVNNIKKGDIDVMKADDYFEKILGSHKTKWMEPVKKAFAVCNERVTKNKDDIKKILSEDPFSMDDTICDSTYIYISGCMHVELFRGCPKTEYSESPKCNEWKSFLDTCADNYENMKVIATKIQSLNQLDSYKNEATSEKEETTKRSST